MAAHDNTEALLRAALAAGGMNAFAWDLATGRVTRIGETERFVGVPAAMLGTTADEYFALVHDDDREAMRQVFAALRPEAPELVHEYRVLAGGRTRWVRDSARAEFDAEGRVTFVRGMAVDVTDRRDAEARLRVISDVSELIGAVEEPDELLYEISRVLGEHLHVRRCLFTELDHEHDRGIVVRDYCRGVPSVAGVYRISDYAETTRREMQNGAIVVNSDAQLDPRTAAEYERTYARTGERAYIAVPLLRDRHWVAELWVSDDRPRQWSEHDVALLRSVAERAWTAVEKLRVHAALRESEARMQFAGEQATVGYWYWDLERDALDWSPVCRRLLGLPEGESVHYERWRALLHPEDRDVVHEAVWRVLTGPPGSEYDVEYRVVHGDGSTHWVHAKGSASFAGGRAVRMAGIVLDVTARKALEAEREQLLQRERRLRAEADQASGAKDHFLALLSHELRTPMTTILGWASFIRSGAVDEATMSKGIESIEQASRTQSRLIDDLLDVSRIVSGKMMLDRRLLDVADLVRNAIEVTQPAAHLASVALHADLGSGPAFVLGDATRLQQIVWNLLSNAVKFTPAGGSVDVKVVQREETVEVHVRDSGVGIDPAFLPYVFERFRQGEDGPTRRFGGLGLSIVRHLADAHGGSVEASSEGAGRGAEFVVRLPRARQAPEPAPARKATGRVDLSALRGVRVLLVDDERGAREVLGSMLAGFGATVTSAASAAEAVERFEAARPDVLVSDLAMPDEDGYALIARLRRSASHVPAIAVTAYADPRDRERALAAGYQAHLAKPVEPHTLAATVLRVLA